MFVVILSIDGNIICDTDGSMATTVCFVNLELKDVLAHA